MEKFNVLIQAYQHLKKYREKLCSIIMKFLTANDACLHLVCQNVNTQTSRDPSRLSGPSSNWEFTSSHDLFTSLNSEIPTSEQSETQHNYHIGPYLAASNHIGLSGTTSECMALLDCTRAQKLKPHTCEHL